MFCKIVSAEKVDAGSGAYNVDVVVELRDDAAGEPLKTVPLRLDASATVADIRDSIRSVVRREAKARAAYLRAEQLVTALLADAGEDVAPG